MTTFVIGIFLSAGEFFSGRFSHARGADSIRLFPLSGARGGARVHRHFRSRNKAVARIRPQCEARMKLSQGSAAVAESEGPKVVIKKYANRRLYNTAKSSYVTLDDLARMVRSGTDFVVFDAKSGEDITRSVLTQIIVEEEAGDQNMLPTNFLRQLIRLYGDPLQGVVPSYLEAAMQAFSRNQEQLRRAFGGSQAIENFEQIARSNMELFERSMRMFTPFGPGGGVAGGTAGGQASGPQDGQSGGQAGGQSGGASAAPARTPTEEKELSDDLEALQRQLSEMQEQLERLSRSKV
jgi:polyhydroxyalkanoate synthesis repressor PhaR